MHVNQAVKRLRSSLVQAFLQNTCFVAWHKLAKENEMVSNGNSIAVSIIVGCWEAYGKEGCISSVEQVCQLTEQGLIFSLILSELQQTLHVMPQLVNHFEFAPSLFVYVNN